MNRFHYKAYFGGPDKSYPFRKSQAELTRALKNFQNDLPHFLTDINATIETPSPQPDKNSSYVTVVTNSDEDSTNRDVAKCLGSLQLYAERNCKPR